MVAMGLCLSPAAEFEDGAGLNVLYTLRGAIPPPREVLIVAVDASTAKTLGLPERPDRWPRALHARLIAGLRDSGATVVGFDMLFQQPRDPLDDQAFRDALRRAGNVVLAEAIVRDTVQAPDGRVIATADRRILPMPMLAEAALATAPFVLPKTPTGVFDFWPRVPSVGDRPSIPAVMAEAMRRAGYGRPDGNHDAAPTQRPDGPSAGPAPRRILNFYGPLGTVSTLSYARALELIAEPAAAAAVFGGKAVLVGLSESNQSRQADAYRTPFTSADGVDLSGVEICATALGNQLEQSWLRRPGAVPTLLILAACAALLTLPWALFRPMVAALLTLLVALVYGVVAHVAFARAHLWLPVVIPLGFSPAIACGLGIVAHYRTTQRRRAELEKAVALGLPAKAVERLSAMLGGGLGGKTVFAICLASDIEAYTALSETLSPTATRDALNAYFARFVPVIESHGGYVADMVGDSVMSLWVADTTPQTAFRDACAAVLELDRTMNLEANAGAMSTRFGLHCGPIYFGDVGTDGRQEMRAVGDIVNTTSRIENANKYLHTRVLVSGEVAAHLDGAVTRPLGRFTVKGKTRDIELVQLSLEALPAAASRCFLRGLEAFRAGDFAAAADHFAAAREAGDAGPAAFYLEQCQLWQRHPPDFPWRGSAVLPGK